MIRALDEFHQTYSDADGTPIFSGGSYFVGSSGSTPSEQQQQLNVVDSFAVSIRLALATLGLLKVLPRTPY